MTPAPDLTCHACGAVHDHARLLQLGDGRAFSNYSEEWRHETEARSIARQGFSERQSHLAAIRRMRGDRAADALEKTIEKMTRG